MVSANDLCCALEELLAIQWDKQYRTWKEQCKINLARALAAQYRTETNSLPSEESLILKPAEMVTYQDGKVEEAFDLSETTSVDAIPLGIFSSEPSAEVHYSEYRLESEDFDQPNVTNFSGYQERHPALPY